MEPITATLATSGAGLISGYIARIIKEGMNFSHQRQMAQMKQLELYEKSMDAAANRSTPQSRKALIWALLFAVVLVPAGVILFTDKGVAYPVEKTRSFLFGLVSWGKTLDWHILKAYPYVPEILQAFNLMVSFIIGQGPAKAR